MKYAIQAKMFAGLVPTSAQMLRHPAFYHLLRGTRWVTGPIAYLGLLVAPSVVVSIPFNVLRWIKVAPPSIPYWIAASCVVAVTLWVSYRLLYFAIHAVRGGVLDTDAIVGGIGFALAAALNIFIFCLRRREF